ncbi:MAG: RibD family protein [Acidobacteriota bacterium]
MNRRIKAFRGSPRYCVLRIGGEPAVSINSPLTRSLSSFLVGIKIAPRCRLPKTVAEDADALLQLRGLIEVSFCRAPRLSTEVLRLLELYLPFCFLSLQARRARRAIALSHFAQSLDGWIATISGDSRWIGGPGNLVHAHRMRALFDAILVGSHTLSRDRPRLTVRHVSGDNPVRIVLGRNLAGLESLLRSSRDPVILVGGQPPFGSKRCLNLPLKRKNGFVPTGQILRELYKRGIHSVYIEGGSITASRFLQENTLDIIQVHIAPLILGPGLPVFLLPPAQRVSHALRFRSFFYTPVDDGIMFTGVPKKGGRKG